MQIHATIVLFHCRITESLTLKSLLKFVDKVALKNKIKFTIFDNSPRFNVRGPKQLNDIYKNISTNYIASEKNIGLAGAYNEVIKNARHEKDEYIWLLDQDTEINEDYFNDVLNFQKLVLVPQVISNSIYISPKPFSSPFKIKKVKPGEHVGISAINSGSLINLHIFDTIGKFNEEFPLDFLDTWFYFELYKNNIVIDVSNVSILHHLSVTNTRNVTSDRYLKILKSEYLFYKKFDTDSLTKYKVHFVLRMLSQLFIKRDVKKFQILFLFFIKKDEGKI